jgi:tetratricopeptide (TPR) repeat protein
MASRREQSIEELLAREKWDDARKRLQKELAREPESHWLLTQLGVTYYEQGRYQEALRHFLASLEIVPDCPLTLWNLAGTLDALGKPEEAIAIYTWLIRSKATPAEDPCWESEVWTNALKTDCVYRLGVCFEHQGRKDSAEHCFRRYIDLLLAGMNGSYPIDEAARPVRSLGNRPRSRSKREVRKAFDSALEDAGVPAITNGPPRPSQRKLNQLLVG